MSSLRILTDDPLLRQNFHDEKITLVDGLFLKRPRREPGFHRRMFDEDFANIFNILNRSSKNQFEITSNDDVLAQKLFLNVETRYAAGSVNEAIEELTEQVALSLVCLGKAYYYHFGNAEREASRIVSLDSNGVFRVLGNYFQWVPKRLQRNWDRDDEEYPREIRLLDSARILRFNLPSPLKQVLDKQNRILTALDKHKFLETQFLPKATLENPNPSSHFDFRLWSDIQERTLYRATRKTGWNARNYHQAKRSDFFICQRLIRFRRNQLLLRDHILKQIGNQFSRIGKPHNPDFTVEISATTELPNIEELNELEVRLEREEAGFDEILDYCYQR